MLRRLDRVAALWLAGILASTAAVPADAVTYFFNGSIRSREVAPGIVGPVIWAETPPPSTLGLSLARSGVDGYAAASGSPLNGGTVSTSAFGVTNAYAATASLFYQILFDAPATAKARVTVTAKGTISSWGSGYSFASFSLGDQYLTANTFTIDGAPRLRNFTWTRSQTLAGGTLLDVSLLALSWANEPGGTNLYGPGSASAFIDPVVAISPVPEPATWTLLVAGFGAAGTALRRAGAMRPPRRA